MVFRSVGYPNMHTVQVKPGKNINSSVICGPRY